ncbi:MAG: ABC transporter permease [Bryobacteraceae bacterium]|nr:ABC transporter permease [Bryobacteraceae bacterium]
MLSLKDVTYAARLLRRDPGFTAVVVVSIALGIAVNTTVFSIVHATLLGDLPVREPGRLLALDGGNSISWPDFRDYRAQAGDVFQGVAGYFPLVPVNLSDGGRPERVWGQAATGNYFDVAGSQPVLGRGFTAEDDAERGKSPVVVLSNGLWKRRFGGDSAIVGRKVTMNNQPYSVIGVAAPGFTGTIRGFVPEFWVPLSMVHELMPDIGKIDRERRDSHWIIANVRLKDDVSREQALARVNVIKKRIQDTYHKDRKQFAPARLEPAGGMPGEIRTQTITFVSVLMVVVGMVLLVACANVANLLLARAASRQKEIGIRLAVGAGRGRLVRQLLTESLLLASLGAAAGFGLSMIAVRAVAQLELPLPFPLQWDFSPNLAVFGYAVAMTLVTGLLFGLVPALRATKPDLLGALKEDSGTMGRLRSFGLRNGLVVAQVALSLVLLIGAGLFLRSLRNASTIDTGLKHAGNVLLMAVDPKLHKYTQAQSEQFFRELERRLETTPGVRSSSLLDVVPLSIGGSSMDYEYRSAAGPRTINGHVFNVGARYFETMGVGLVRGRDFGRDLVNSRKVAIVNETAVERLFGAEDPIGKVIQRDKDKYEVIGVVRNSKSRSLGEGAEAMVYHYINQDFGAVMSFFGTVIAVRTDGRPESLVPAVRNHIAALDPHLAVFNTETMGDHIGKALLIPRLCATILGICGVTGLVLATVGLYGVLSYTVRRRTREIGIRMALGAPAGGVLRAFTGQGLVLAGVGMVIGLAFSFLVSRFAAPLLYGVPPTDPVTFLGVPGLLLAVALIAALIPARRAARTEPIRALRYE